MAHRIDRILSSLIEFIARTWPVSKTKEQVIGDYQRVWSKAGSTGDQPDGD